MSAAAQVIHILRNAKEQMDAHAIYVAGGFDYEGACYNGLNQLWKKDVICRVKVDGVYRYWIPDGASIPEYLERDIAVIEEDGLPAPDPTRRIGMSRAEYTKKTTEETVVVTRMHHDDATRQPAIRALTPKAALIVEEPPSGQEGETTPAPNTDLTIEEPANLTLSRQGDLLRKFTEQRDALQAKVDAMHLLMEFTDAHGICHLADLLEDYAEMLECGTPDDEVLIQRAADARQFAAGARAMDRGMFERVIHHLNFSRNVSLECAADDDSQHGTESRRDAEEMRELIVMLGGTPTDFSGKQE